MGWRRCQVKVVPKNIGACHDKGHKKAVKNINAIDRRATFAHNQLMFRASWVG